MVMPPPRVRPEDYIDFLIATPKAASGVEAARVQPDKPRAPAHDAFTRLLHRLEPDAETLWLEAQPQVDLLEGVLGLDDSVLDKPYSKPIDLVGRHWSCKHHAVVQGIDLVSLLWTDGDRHVPCDYRIYHDAKTATKAVYRGGALPGALRDRAAEPHRPGVAGVPAAGVLRVHPRRQLDGGQVGHHPRGRAFLPRPSLDPPLNYVTPINNNDPISH